MKTFKHYVKQKLSGIDVLIRKQIAGRFEPLENKDIPEPNMHQVIVKKSPGQSFKGHVQQVWFNRDQGTKGMIISQNQYYSGTVSQVYDIDQHETRTNFTAGGNVPKWLAAKLDEIGRVFNPLYVSNVDPFLNYTLEIDDNPIMNIGGMHWSVKYVTRAEGVNFLDHSMNIKELKQLNLLYRKLRNKIKSDDVKSISRFCHPIDGTNSLNLKLNKNYLL